MSRRRQKRPVLHDRYDLKGVQLVSCVLRGHGECSDRLEPWLCYNDRGLHHAVDQRLLPAVCGAHGDMLRAGGRLREHLGMWVPRWVLDAAPHAAQLEYVIKEMMALRSTARQCTPGELTEAQWPFWMANEKQAWIAECARAEAIAAHNEMADRSMAAMVAGARGEPSPASPPG